MGHQWGSWLGVRARVCCPVSPSGYQGCCGPLRTLSRSRRETREGRASLAGQAPRRGPTPQGHSQVERVAAAPLCRTASVSQDGPQGAAS